MIPIAPIGETAHATDIDLRTEQEAEIVDNAVVKETFVSGGMIPATDTDDIAMSHPIQGTRVDETWRRMRRPTRGVKR